MERKEQTGHICRWMALGIMTAIVIVGCTIVIGLFEWRDRKEIECRNAELHQWRKNVHDLNLHITELSLLGEMVADWDSTDVNEYHSLRLEVDSMLEGIAGICPKEDSDTICRLLAEKEQLLLDIKDAMQELNATQEKLTAEVPRIVEQNKTESKRLSAMPQQAKPKKRGFFSRLFGKQQKQIFKEFARLGNAVTQPGFGLGLSIVKNLVSLMKGKIDVSSHQGLGSIFTISLPMAAAEKQNVEPIQYRTKRQDSFTVIAIDDSHVQLSTIREAFASNGIVCDTCNNATDLLDMMRKKSYDLLITDLKMAEVNGIEILEMMRMVNVRNSKTIPVVVMTAAPNVSEQELLDAGFVACLFKPMSDKDLINTARKCVNGKIAEKQIDFSMLLTYGNEKETLENFVKEMTDTLGSIRNVAKEENRKKMSDVIHHARSSWMMVQSDESLNYLFDLIEDSTSSDDVINQAVEDVFAHGEEIIKAAQKKIEEVTA